MNASATKLILTHFKWIKYFLNFFSQCSFKVLFWAFWKFWLPFSFSFTSAGVLTSEKRKFSFFGAKLCLFGDPKFGLFSAFAEWPTVWPRESWRLNGSRTKNVTSVGDVGEREARVVISGVKLWQSFCSRRGSLRISPPLKQVKNLPHLNCFV